MGRALRVRHVATAPSAVVLVCRKCTKKLGGGFGLDGEERLTKLLRRELGGRGKARKARTAIIEVGCLGLCPKEAVVLLRGDRPNDWLVVRAGTPVAEIEAALGLLKENTAPG